MIATIVRWATESATEEGESGEECRREYGIRTTDPDELARRICVVRDQTVCARAGRAYSADDHLPFGTYAVAVVAVGDRYIAPNVDAIRREGEFIIEVVLDRAFHVVEWLGT